MSVVSIDRTVDFDVDRHAEALEGVRRGVVMTATALLILFCLYTVPDLRAGFMQALGWVLTGLGVARIGQGVHEAKKG